MNYSGNGDASIDMEGLVKSIKEKLDKLSFPSPECCIYKVPRTLKNINEEAYTPRTVSIGPLHHGKEGLKDMEEHKLRYFNDFMQRSGKSLVELVMIMEEKEKEIRACYVETINIKSEMFLEIILVDAAFIIEVLLRCWFDDLRTPNDRIFRKPWMIFYINDDLLLLENQIPFFVLQDLLKMTNIQVGFQFSQNETLPDPVILTIKWFVSSLQIRELLGPEHINPSEIKHVLDLLRICLMPKQKSQPPEEKNPSKVNQFIAFLGSFIPRQSLQQTESKFDIPSATELHEAGVKFEVSSSKNLFDIKFRGNVLEIPRTEIYDWTESSLRNIIAYEQCHCTVRYFADYTAIMGFLIKTSKDVELLVKAKIIENCLGNNSDVSNLFNGLGKEVVISKEYYFTKLHEELNDYCKIRSHMWKATLKQNYCNTPWIYYCGCYSPWTHLHTITMFSSILQ
ncbi:UPF0481 protein At3g47200-like [Camellia sinensis]|uniref:Uncharacterized protein n=1 Tax=Camellia sinensis var. sinensis TaxID=542762 RepID=A0A4V6RYB7_CAMSN|nr:UPF0481 protein At3g47200-like [Camellia sinensis]THG06347.1 hypothetical protein TEA_019983 [Camellia sinensis var. sinensis]